MLASLALGEKSVGELAEPFAMSFAGASKHVKVLEQAGLIRREVRGRTHICRLEPGPLASADQWLRYYEGFWTGRLDALERLLREDDVRKATSRKSKSPTGDEQ
jgi:DNA-binding transcriptional ArsR family regulator